MCKNNEYRKNMLVKRVNRSRGETLRISNTYIDMKHFKNAHPKSIIPTPTIVSKINAIAKQGKIQNGDQMKEREGSVNNFFHQVIRQKRTHNIPECSNIVLQSVAYRSNNRIGSLATVLFCVTSREFPDSSH